VRWWIAFCAWEGLLGPIWASDLMSWDFERGASNWALKAPAMALVAEPGVATNHVLRIRATAPHHTKITVPGSEGASDFQMSLRYRFSEAKGAAPRIYLYGRDSGAGFRGVSLGPEGRGTVMDYRGKGNDSEDFGGLSVPGLKAGGWIRVVFACVGPNVFAKVWADGQREPAWQVVAEGKPGAQGRASIGAWLSPRSPSSATLLLDDVRFGPVSREELHAWLKPNEPRPPLAKTDIPDKRGIFRTVGRVGIATASMAIAFDEHTGEVANLVARASGREFIEARARRPLFVLDLMRPRGGERMEVSASDFARRTVREDEPGHLVIEFGDGPVGGIVVRARVRALDSCQLGLDIELTNDSGWCVASVAYPQMPFALALGGDASDDRLLVPFQGGALIGAPGQKRMVRGSAYPGGCPVPFYAYYDDAAGLYVSPHDPGGRCKLFELACTQRSVNMDVVHRFPEERRGELHLPYEVIMATFEGDWRKAAERYRIWSTQRLWQCQTLNLRDDVPAFLKEGYALVIDSFRGAEGARQKFGDDGRKLLATLDAYRERTGVKGMIFVPYGWEGRGTWAGINYLPAQPSNEYWTKVNALLEAHGHRSAALLSGYWWVVKRKETSNGPAFDDTAQFDRLKDMCVANADGSIWKTDNYDQVGTFGDWRGLSVGLCHGSAKAADTLLAQFLGTARLGFPLVSFDQEIGGGQHAPCYATGHGHSPGYGDWMWTGFRDLCARIREGGRGFEPEMGLFMENESDLAVPLMATYWSRQFGEVDIGGMAGARGVGLFSYIYHDFVTAIGAACVQGQGPLGTNPDVLLRCRALANNLTRGLIPGPFVHLVPLDPGKDRYKQACSAAFLSFCRPYSRFPEYLLLGRSVPPADIACDEVDTWYFRRRLSAGEARDPAMWAEAQTKLKIAAVTAGAFEAANGSEAHIVVNGTPDARTATASFGPGPEAIIYSAERKELARVPAFRQPRKVSLDLEPFGVRVIVVR